MAKDPAILFYSADFMMGTALMSETEVGQYIRIMCHMHQSGHLSLEDMKNICPNISSKVVAKFKQDSNGLYFNERLELEINKRKKYSESRRNNRLKEKTKTYDTTHDSHMSIHMENVNENTNENIIEEKGVQGETIPPLSDKWFGRILDEKEIETLHMTFRDKDVEQELITFKAKARAAPSQYQHRDKAGIMLAIHSQLRSAKKKIKNGTHLNTSAVIAPGRTAGKL